MTESLELYFIVMVNIEELSNKTNARHLCVVDFMPSTSESDARVQLENRIRNKYSGINHQLKLETVMFHAVPREFIDALKIVAIS